MELERSGLDLRSFYFVGRFQSSLGGSADIDQPVRDWIDSFAIDLDSFSRRCHDYYAADCPSRNGAFLHHGNVNCFAGLVCLQESALHRGSCCIKEAAIRAR